MTDMTFQPAESLPEALDDAMVTAMRPMVRAQLLKRMNDLFKLSDGELESGKDRVRWAELQLRIADRIAKWCRLEVPAGPEEPADDVAGVEQERVRMLVTMQLDELAERDGG
jgi:hypothetical protein